MAIDISGLSDEQKNSILFQKAIEESRIEAQREQELTRVRSEAVRLAKETLIENKRSLPADQREVTADEITQYADTLINYISDTNT